MSTLWVDVLVVAVVLWYAYAGYRVGFMRSFFDLLGTVLVLILAFKAYPVVAHFLTARYQVFRSFANMIGFLTLFLFGQLIYFGFLCIICDRLVIAARRSRWAWTDKILGLIPGLVSGLVLTTLFLSVLVALPLTAGIKSDISNSWLGGPLFASSGFLAPYIEQTLGQPANDLLAFLTPRPQEPLTENLELPEVEASELSVDAEVERRMLSLVNQARRERGLRRLVRDALLTSAAREHSREMWELGYFAHDSPVSGRVVQRLLRAGADFTVAGENIALAADVFIAHRGLMNSSGHRANILDPNFRRIGIGVVSAGVYGEMFTQDFTN